MIKDIWSEKKKEREKVRKRERGHLGDHGVALHRQLAGGSQQNGFDGWDLRRGGVRRKNRKL